MPASTSTPTPTTARERMVLPSSVDFSERGRARTFFDELARDRLVNRFMIRDLRVWQPGAVKGSDELRREGTHSFETALKAVDTMLNYETGNEGQVTFGQSKSGAPAVIEYYNSKNGWMGLQAFMARSNSISELQGFALNFIRAAASRLLQDKTRKDSKLSEPQSQLLINLMLSVLEGPIVQKILQKEGPRKAMKTSNVMDEIIGETLIMLSEAASTRALAFWITSKEGTGDVYKKDPTRHFMIESALQLAGERDMALLRTSDTETPYSDGSPEQDRERARLERRALVAIKGDRAYAEALNAEWSSGEWIVDSLLSSPDAKVRELGLAKTYMKYMRISPRMIGLYETLKEYIAPSPNVRLTEQRHKQVRKRQEVNPTATAVKSEKDSFYHAAGTRGELDQTIVTDVPTFVNMPHLAKALSAVLGSELAPGMDYYRTSIPKVLSDYRKDCLLRGLRKYYDVPDSYMAPPLGIDPRQWGGTALSEANTAELSEFYAEQITASIGLVKNAARGLANADTAAAHLFMTSMLLNHNEDEVDEAKDRARSILMDDLIQMRFNSATMTDVLREAVGGVWEMAGYAWPARVVTPAIRRWVQLAVQDPLMLDLRYVSDMESLAIASTKSIHNARPQLVTDHYHTEHASTVLTETAPLLGDWGILLGNSISERSLVDVILALNAMKRTDGKKGLDELVAVLQKTGAPAELVDMLKKNPMQAAKMLFPSAVTLLASDLTDAGLKKMVAAKLAEAGGAQLQHEWDTAPKSVDTAPVLALAESNRETAAAHAKLMLENSARLGADLTLENLMPATVVNEKTVLELEEGLRRTLQGGSTDSTSELNAAITALNAVRTALGLSTLETFEARLKTVQGFLSPLLPADITPELARSLLEGAVTATGDGSAHPGDGEQARLSTGDTIAAVALMSQARATQVETTETLQTVAGGRNMGDFWNSPVIMQLLDVAVAGQSMDVDTLKVVNAELQQQRTAILENMRIAQNAYLEAMIKLARERGDAQAQVLVARKQQLHKLNEARIKQMDRIIALQIKTADEMVTQQEEITQLQLVTENARRQYILLEGTRMAERAQRYGEAIGALLPNIGAVPISFTLN
ncbi:MAG: hypothetical protein V1922_01780 [bacterium]